MTAGALAFLAAARSVEGWKREGRRGPLASWASAATIVGIGAGIAAAQILPGARFLRGSFRGGPLNPEAAAFSSMPVENLLQLAFPQFLGTVNGGRYWGRGYPWEVFGWAGILAPAGACVGVTARTPTRGTARWYAAMALGGLVFALGPATPLYPALCRVAPVLGRMNVPGRFVFLWTLGLSVAAGLGWSALFAPGAEAAALRRLWSIRWIKAALLGLFVLAALFAVEGGDSDAWKGLAQREAEAQDALMTNWKGKEDSRAFAAWRRATFANSMADCVGGVGLLLLAAGAVGAASKSGGRKAAAFGAFAFLIQAGDLLRVGGDMAAPAPMRPAVWDESLADEIRQSGGRVETSATLPKVGPSALNRGMIERIPMVWGYEPGAPRRFVELANASQDVSLLRFNPFLSVRGTGPIQDLLGARWRVDKPAAQGAPADGPAKRDYGFFAIYENPDAMPRAWVAPRGENAGAWSSILLALTSGKARPRETALFEEAPPQAPPGSATGARAESAPATGAARIAAESANRVAVDYDAAAGGFLVLADRWDSGWRATVNGRNVPLLRAFGVLRAVPVEAGTGQVVFVYRPWDFYLGLVVSLGSMVFLLTWRPLFKTLFRRIRKRIDHAVAKV
ncbi:MAG: YfhO family protein, partial [Candidatus Sumerlaeota bacterium]|nr:YfhO family protein [Candidatus Sumerlaeota bacterium]